MKYLSRLAWLDLDGTALDDYAVEYLGVIHKIKYIGVSHTKITEHGLRRLKHLLPGCAVIADHLANARD